jgi:RNA polymerase sigma factor (sigma-70 family)
MVAQRTLVHGEPVQVRTTRSRSGKLHLVKKTEPLEEDIAIKRFDRAIRRLERIDKKKPKGRPPEKEIKPFVEGSKKHALVAKNYWATIWYANFCWRLGYKRAGIQFDDLVQAAGEGMMRAADKYKKSTGVKFLTYAVPWMRCYIMKELRKNGIIHVPSASMISVKDTVRAIEAIENGISTEGFNKTATKRYSMFIEKPSLVEKRKKRAEQTTAAMCAARNMKSIDAAKKNDEGETRYHQLPAETRTDSEATANQLAELILNSMRMLSETEKDIIKSRKYTDDPKTLEEIGEIYKVSRERIRQIQQTALRKLRESRVFADYALPS